MDFKIDENLPGEVAILLEEKDHDAMTVFQQDLVGEADPVIAKICQMENRALITLDTDFADIRSYPPNEYNGLIVLRLKRQDKQYVLTMFKRLIRILAIEKLDKHLWIFEEDRIRIRTNEDSI